MESVFDLDRAKRDWCRRVEIGEDNLERGLVRIAGRDGNVFLNRLPLGFRGVGTEP